MTGTTTRRAFVAGPFKQLVDDESAGMRGDDRSRFTAIIEALERDGYEVYNAHRREGWGAKFLPPEECTRLDFEEISRSDVLVAFPGVPASPGTHIEIGWASAMGKPLVLLLEGDAEYAFLVRGLHSVADVHYVRIDPADHPGAAARVATAVHEAVVTAADRG